MKPARKTFLYVFCHLLARNELLYSSGKKPMTDEILLIELSNFDFGRKVRRVEQLIDPQSVNVTIAKLRGQFNRGELHQGSTTTPPNFFSFRYSEEGKRLGARGILLSPEEQNDMIARFQSHRDKWHRKRLDRAKGEACEPKFLLRSPRSSVIGPSASDAHSAGTG
jgi:hypothetical protein